MEPATGWGESTVRTLIHRLIRKGALKSERRRGVVVYASQLSREVWLTAESQGLLDRLFGGRLAAMVAHLAHQRALASEDMARLRRLWRIWTRTKKIDVRILFLTFPREFDRFLSALMSASRPGLPRQARG